MIDRGTCDTGETNVFDTGETNVFMLTMPTVLC